MLSSTQKKLLERIKGKLAHGDIEKIALKADYDRSYVGKCLNPLKAVIFNEDIVNAARALIIERKEAEKKALEQVTAA